MMIEPFAFLSDQERSERLRTSAETRKGNAAARRQIAGDNRIVTLSVRDHLELWELVVSSDPGVQSAVLYCPEGGVDAAMGSDEKRDTNGKCMRRGILVTAQKQCHLGSRSLRNIWGVELKCL